MEMRPLYTISIIADLMGVHPETLRVWSAMACLSLLEETPKDYTPTTT
jgi:DNA-binding transcriptional MerR regulator